MRAGQGWRRSTQQHNACICRRRMKWKKSKSSIPITAFMNAVIDASARCVCPSADAIMILSSRSLSDPKTNRLKLSPSDRHFPSERFVMRSLALMLRNAIGFDPTPIPPSRMIDVFVWRDWGGDSWSDTHRGGGANCKRGPSPPIRPRKWTLVASPIALRPSRGD
jgi:hypothetical protein